MNPSRELTCTMMNAALLPASIEIGYCLCIHPMMHIINFAGTDCMWCRQPVPENAISPELKVIRTKVILEAYPWAARNDKT